MKKISLIILLITGTAPMLFSQDLFWKAGLFSFFDNNEFSGSSYKISQTMSGISISPEAGITWDSVHKVSVGVNLIHEFGSTEAIDRYYPTAFYRYSKNSVRFIMGAFPRTMMPAGYPRLFIQDSLTYYRPNINGMLLQYGHDKRYINIWLDWTGRQAERVREAFFVGLSGKYNFGMFWAEHYSSMFHYASRKDPVFREPLHDNMLLKTSVGMDLAGKTFFDALEGSAGWVLGLERERIGDAEWISMNGFIAEIGAEYRFAGIRSSFYAGRGLMHFYNDHENNLYWGDPVYRAKVYDRTDLFVNFLRRDNVDLELTWSLHFLEGRVYNEQMLKLRVNLEKSFGSSDRR